MAASVLLVDDEPALLRAYERWLRIAGHTVETAPDGTTAAQLVAAKSFDVVISDIAMDGMTGVQLLRSVRERDLDVPVILMTGAPAIETAINAVEHGALRYLVKPIAGTELQDVVAHAVRLHKLAKLKRHALEIVGAESDPCALDSLGASLDRVLASLVMAYQPIVRWSTRQTFAFEALLRSRDPLLPSPTAVLDAAERLGRLDDLGRTIRAHVASLVEAAPAECVFVNLHPRDLLDDELYAATSPLSRVAERVVLEITERATLDEVTDAARRIAKLRAMGYRIAVDDLGAGYAGLTSFARLEPDVVKFDMSLVRDVHVHDTKRKLIQSMRALFDELGMLVIAEGVETIEERDALVEVGCDLLQGYLFARPGPPFPTTG